MDRHYLNGNEIINITRHQTGELNQTEIVKYTMPIGDAIAAGYLSTDQGTMKFSATLNPAEQVEDCADPTISRDEHGKAYVMVLDETEWTMVQMGSAVIENGMFRMVD